MPTKRNRAGKQQNYVEAGHGDASGEYGDNATGSNIHFQSFKKPSEKPKVKIRKVIDDLGISTYYKYDDDGNYYWNTIQKDFERNPRYKNEGWKLEEKEIEYDEEKVKNDLINALKESIEDNSYNNSFSFLAKYKSKLNEEDRDSLEYFMMNDKNKSIIGDEVKNLKSQKNNVEYQKMISAGKEALSKLPKIEGNISVNDNVTSVNKTNYDRTKTLFWSNKEEYEKYHSNCQKCVQAFELRMRGYNVEALERPKDRSKDYDTLKKSGWDLSMYIPPKDNTFEAYGNDWFFGDKVNSVSRNDIKPLSNKRSISQKSDIERIVKEAGKGARFQCSVAWKGGGAHVFNIINDDGTVRFIDCQSGDLDCSRYFDSGRIKPKDTMIIRVDNLELNGNVSMIAKGR